MKKSILFVLTVLAFAACKKDNDPAPNDPATAVSGNYTIRSFLYIDGADTINLPTLPASSQGISVSGTLTAARSTSNFVNLLLTLKQTGATDSTLPIDSVEVRQTGNSYGLYLDDTSLGTADGSTINFNVAETDPQTNEPFIIRFEARK
ncbi:hypothetical protein GCM10027341_04910 [Spirosoma knui]